MSEIQFKHLRSHNFHIKNLMCLGIGLEYVPGMPAEFFAGFYPGLGIALSIAGIRYLYSWCKVVYTSK